jgi:hypothetical protein
MIKGIEYSKRLAALCALVLSATVAMVCLYEEMETRRHLRLNAYGNAVRCIAEQIAARADCEDSDLVALRGKVERSRSLLGSKDTLEILVRTFGTGWSIISNAKDDRSGFEVQLSTFRMRNPTLGDWQKIVDLVGSLEQLPGVGIENFRMNTSGDIEHREVSVVEVIVESRLQISNHSSTSQ